MSNKRNTVQDIALVTISNVIAIAAGIITGFLLPKIFSVEDYGYYKTFTLYTGYMGLLNLGIADGIVLKYGGCNYNELDHKRFRSYFRWFEIVHIILCGIMILTGVLLQGESGFIIISLAINTIIINTVSYFQQISQITQRFKEFSMRKVIQAASGIIIAGLFLLIRHYNGNIGYRQYIIMSLIFSLALTIWYFSTYRMIIFGESISLKMTGKEIIHFIITGFPLLFANLCSTLILTLDRQFVNILFDKTEYAVYAFAYSMLSLVTVATSAASTVLFPTLKRTSVDNLRNNYSKLIGVMLVFVFGAMVGYYPLYFFINWFLPKYSESLIIFRIIFPGLAISSCITVIMHNYYKVLGKNLLYFKKSLIILVLSALTNGVAYTLFRTTTSISIASIITMVFWYLYTERLFVYEYKTSTWNNNIYMLLMGASFYIITLIPNMYVSLGVYVLFYCFATFILKKDIISEVKDLFGREKNQ